MSAAIKPALIATTRPKADAMGEPLLGEFAANPSRPLPGVHETSFWEGTSRGELVLQQCTDCEYITHPPGPRCMRCQSSLLEPVPVSGYGTIYSFAVVHRAFHPYFEAKVPYVVGSIALDEQDDLRVFSRVVGIQPAAVEIGRSVQVCFERTADGANLPLFRPRNEECAIGEQESA
jgi:uncharacterized OB-fold protein